jgi:hypothetical protein
VFIVFACRSSVVVVVVVVVVIIVVVVSARRAMVMAMVIYPPFARSRSREATEDGRATHATDGVM